MRRAFVSLTEMVLLFGSGLAAAWARLSADISWEMVERRGFAKLLLSGLILQLAFYFFDLYELRSRQSYRKVLRNLVKSYLTAGLSLSLLFYFWPQLALGRGIFSLYLVISFLVMAAWRYFINWGAYHPQLGARERVLILGSGEHAIQIARAALERPGEGFQIVGFVDDKPELVGKSLINPSVVGLTSELSELVRRYRVDRLVVAVEDRRGKFPVKELLELSLSRQVTIEEGTRFYERLTGKVGVVMARPSCFIFSDLGRHSNLTRRIRRAANVALAALGLVASLPLMLIIGLAIKLDSRGPIFYTQERVGKGGRRFKIIKFRSMRADAENESGPKWAEQDDPRVTRVGRIIRRLRLDELPQFINVLRGDMNFIGPRPERPEFVEELSRLIPYYSQRHLIRPGLTGWAQINYPYGASIEDAIEKLQYDLYYIKNRSFLLDAMIIFETIKIVLFGRGAR